MKKLITLITSIILIFVMSLGAFTLIGCGRDIESDGEDLPSVNTPGSVDDPNDGGNSDGGSSGSGSGSQGGGSSGGSSGGGSQLGGSVTMTPDGFWRCGSCNNPTYNIPNTKDHCPKCGAPKP